jgi:hypothetical protein
VHIFTYFFPYQFVTPHLCQNSESSIENRREAAKLCCEEVDTTPLMPSDDDTSVTPSIDASLRTSSTMTNTTGTDTMCQKFNIRTPNKAA